MSLSVDEIQRRYAPEDIIAALRPQLTDERAARIEQVLGARLSTVTVAIENLHDPHNGAAALRSVESVGLTSLHVIETVEKFEASTAVTIGCEKWVEICPHPTAADCARALRAAGFGLYAAIPGADLDLESVPVDRPCALVFGNEHEGLTAEMASLCDAGFGIPMHGFTRSFNLSVSVALATYRIAARRRDALAAAGDLAPAAGDLDPDARTRLRARWYALGMRGVQGIVERYVSRQTQAKVSG